MSTSPLSIQVTAADRLGLTLFLAIAVHALVILGVSFDIEKSLPRDIPLSLEITLVHSSSTEQPDEADYLAQANQRGGGDIEERRRPTSPAYNPLPNDERGDAEQSTPLSAPPPQARQDKRIMSATVENRHKLPQPQERPQPITPEAPTVADLMMRSRTIARQSAQIDQRQQVHAKKDREKFITANTKEHKYAAYMDAWRQKVERIGNLNYPDEAKRKRLSGNLTLDVVLRPDGSVENIEVLRSSGHKVLDDGAVRIVRLASPFNAFPPEIRKETERLHIIRVWQFQDDSFTHSLH